MKKTRHVKKSSSLKTELVLKNIITKLQMSYIIKKEKIRIVRLSVTNKNDFNSSLAHIETHPKDLKDQNNQLSQEFAPSGTGDNNDEDEDRQDIQNILSDLFPSYQQHFWNERSTSNQLHFKHQNNKTLNDSFDVSFHSIDLKQNPNQIGIATVNDHLRVNLGINNTVNQNSPLMLDDLSIIVDLNRQDKNHTSQEQKQDESALNHDHDHDHHQDMFFEGLTSLFLDRKSGINNLFYMQPNNVGNTLSQSSDSQCKTLKNSLKYKVMVHSSNDLEALNLGHISKLQKEKSECKSRFEIRVVDNIQPTGKELDLQRQLSDRTETENLPTPSFLTPTISHNFFCQESAQKQKISEDICFFQIAHNMQSLMKQQFNEIQSDDQAFNSDKFYSQPSTKRFKITSMLYKPINTQPNQIPYSLTSSQLNSEAATPLAKQKSLVINYDSNLKFEKNEALLSNSQYENQKNQTEYYKIIISDQQEIPVKQTNDIQMSSNDYFQFEGTSGTLNIGHLRTSSKGSNSQQNSEAFVRRFQEMLNLPVDGTVDQALWQIIMNEAQNAQWCNSNEFRLADSNENTFGGVTFDNQSVFTPGPSSPKNLASKEIIINDDNLINTQQNSIIQDNNEGVNSSKKGQSIDIYNGGSTN
ncbi:UNKNOWN [Stylonychia lemnae]|uniref:Uncharacterized protein n=1 Tax=Stylonychia lemnae TaxID=5949 RepID=A0A078AJM6_STYLE|nr:UNKNOWN [Stylonychia lemnae]|eukprot:CDW82575.1 UNKNOWN [Stylonychia lemnae]